MEKERELAIKLLGAVEEFLDRHNITIPSKDREGEPDEARLYGDEYYTLEEDFTEQIKQFKEVV